MKYFLFAAPLPPQSNQIGEYIISRLIDMHQVHHGQAVDENGVKRFRHGGIVRRAHSLNTEFVERAHGQSRTFHGARYSHSPALRSARGRRGIETVARKKSEKNADLYMATNAAITR